VADALGEREVAVAGERGARPGGGTVAEHDHAGPGEMGQQSGGVGRREARRVAGLAGERGGGEDLRHTSKTRRSAAL
jgi:hypothetical protein